MRDRALRGGGRAAVPGGPNFLCHRAPPPVARASLLSSVPPFPLSCFSPLPPYHSLRHTNSLPPLPGLNDLSATEPEKAPPYACAPP